MYYVVAQDNAANMLKTQATLLGTFGEDTFYFLDGKAWRIIKGRLRDTVYRSDDDLESQTILRMCQQANFPENPQCKGCGAQFAINSKVGAHRRGYCSDDCENTTD